MIFVSCNFCLDCKQMNKTCKGITNMHKSSQLPTTQSPLARAERESQKPGSGGRWSIPPASSDCSRDANFSVKVSIRRRNFDSLPRGHSEWRVHTPQKGGGHPPSQQIFLDILLWCFVLLFCCAKWRSFCWSLIPLAPVMLSKDGHYPIDGSCQEWAARCRCLLFHCLGPGGLPRVQFSFLNHLPWICIHPEPFNERRAKTSALEEINTK